MSLVSQNSVSRNVKAKGDDNEPSIHEDSKDIENALESDSEISWLKKRKKEKEQQIEIEQEKEKEKEMKKLENFLCGSIYSPVEFGKEGEENA
ncbi:hypothetical protein CRYUN_Cryun02cG0140000 [Craigia yunnanensis]